MIKNIPNSVLKIFMVLTAIIFLSFCSNPAADTSLTLMDELRALDLDKYIDSVGYDTIDELTIPAWKIYNYDTSVCKCVLGSEFRIGLKEKTDTNNIVFLMDGGGACWPGKDSCAKTAAMPSGWNDSAGNPLNGWSVVHVPYCDGSVHMGDNDSNYDGADHYHRGLKLTTAGIAIMKNLNPNPPKIFITGCSAGGYGTFMAYLLIRRFFPDSALYIFNDSGPGLWNPDNGMKEKIIDAWKFTSYLPKSCTSCDTQIMNLYEWILQRDANVRIGLFSSYNDSIIGGSFLDMISADYKDLLVSTSNSIQSKYPARFNRFLINGTTHCVANAPGTYSYEINSTSLVTWLSQLVNGDSAWNDLLE